MRLKYFFITLSAGILLSLVYTWQQVEIVKLAYQENKKNNLCKELLDKNRSLRYNLLSLKSSSHLGARLFNEATEFEIPASNQMRTVFVSQEASTIKAQNTIIKDGIFLSVFKRKEAWPVSLIKSYIDRQAQAQDTIKK